VRGGRRLLRGRRVNIRRERATERAKKATVTGELMKDVEPGKSSLTRAYLGATRKKGDKASARVSHWTVIEARSKKASGRKKIAKTHTSIVKKNKKG